MALLVLAAAASIAALGCPALPEEGSVNEEWLAADVALAKKTLALLPPGETSVDDFLEKLDASDVREDVVTGFGGRRVFAAGYGGYTTTWIKLAGFDGRLVAIEVTAEGERDPDVDARLAKAWGKSFEKIGRDRRYRWEDAKGLAHYRAAVEKALGKAPAAELPAELADAVALLTSPLERLDVGEACYEGGDAPDGKKATDRLVAAKRFDLLRRVLRGPNPDGRVYAALALLQRAKSTGEPLADADRKAIDVIRKSPVLISVCSGCEVYEATAAEVLSE